MKQSNLSKALIIGSLMLSSLTISSAAMAEGSIQHFGDSAQHLKQSTLHTAGSVAHTLVGSGKLVSGAVALPFKALGKVGDASDAVGELLWENATGATPLEVTDSTVTAGPAPTVAINL